jgi:hypothetical protein
MRDEYQAALDFIQKNGYPMGWKSKEDYDDWLSRQQQVASKRNKHRNRKKRAAEPIRQETTEAAEYLNNTGVFSKENAKQQETITRYKVGMADERPDSLELYEKITSRDGYIDMDINAREAMRENIRNSPEGKAYDDLSGRLRTKHFDNADVNSDVFMMPNSGWNNWHFNDKAMKGTDPRYKTFVSLKDPLNIAEDDVEKLVSGLTDAGYNGQMKHFIDSGRAGTRAESFVFQGFDVDSPLKAAKVTHEIFGDRVDKIWTGIDDDAVDTMRKTADKLYHARIRRTSAEALGIKPSLMAADAAEKFAKYTKVAGGVAGAVIAGATLLHMGMDYQDKQRQKQQTRITRNQSKPEEFDPEMFAELDRLNGLPQQLYEGRAGHSNTWGGKKY